ncbi:MAG TPA: hypothetical protein VGI39_36500 [Polyangiaceae bacterium]|jgi:hypothetical protein
MSLSSRASVLFAITAGLALYAPAASAQDTSPLEGSAATEAPPPPTAAPSGVPLAALPPDSPEKDDGHGTEVLYATAAAGFSAIDMASFSSSTFGVTKTGSFGPMFGVGTGVRLSILQLGVQANLNQLSDFNLWQLDAVLGLHVPSRHWDIHFGIHGGYAFVGTLDSTSVSQVASQSAGAVSIYGGDAGLQLGADYYFNHFLSLGFELAGNALFLHRPPVPLPSGIPAAQLAQVQSDPLYKSSGDSVGLGGIGSILLGVHL